MREVKTALFGLAGMLLVGLGDAACTENKPIPPPPELNSFIFQPTQVPPCPAPVKYDPSFIAKLGNEMDQLKHQGGYAEILQAIQDYRAQRKAQGVP